MTTPTIRITVNELTDPDSPTRPEIPEDATGVDWGNWTECFDVIQWHVTNGMHVEGEGPNEGTLVIGRPGPCDAHKELPDTPEHECPMAPVTDYSASVAGDDGLVDVDLRDLPSHQLRALRREAGEHGDEQMVTTVETILDHRAGASTPVGTVEIAQRLGVQRTTVDQWRQRKLLPEPDWTVGGRPAWRLGTILAWARETGRL
jgi:predicted DNA-binding transcriptional regulator AlpA